MKIRNLIQVGLLGAALAAAQPQYPQYDNRAEHHDVQKDMRHRDELARRVEADRRAVDHERDELRHSKWFAAGQESRELRKAEDRLNRDSAELRALDDHIAREMNRWR